MDYPGRIVKLGEGDAAIVSAIKERLNKALGSAEDSELHLDSSNPSFGPKTAQAVKLFQARNVDSEGRPLKQDGEVGSITWAALFGEESVPVRKKTSDKLLAKVLEVASQEEAKEIREKPRNSNRGAEVEAYLRSVGVPAGNPWCCAFTYWCFGEAAKDQGVSNPMVKTGGCLFHWNNAAKKGAKRISRKEAADNPGLIQPGMIFIMDHGGGFGHTGLIEKVAGGFITTIEGNTDASKTREGGGVYRLTRKIGR
jgi:hypothetical protein